MELIVYHSPGVIMKSGKKYRDQLDPGDSSFRGSDESYLMNKYELTLSQYYSLVVYGDKDYIPVCQNDGCNNLVAFQNLRRGWKKYCCPHCRASGLMKERSSQGLNPFQSKEFIDSHRINLSERYKSLPDKGVSSLLTIESKFNSAKMTFIRKATNGVLYIGYLSELDKYKFGITSYNPKYRRYKGLKMTRIHTLISGSSEFIAELEYELKLEFCKESCIELISSDQLHEFFLKLKSLL